jgi:hypothetical protein
MVERDIGPKVLAWINRTDANIGISGSVALHLVFKLG